MATSPLSLLPTTKSKRCRNVPGQLEVLSMTNLLPPLCVQHRAFAVSTRFARIHTPHLLTAPAPETASSAHPTSPPPPAPPESGPSVASSR